jgi:hypothetical protein
LGQVSVAEVTHPIAMPVPVSTPPAPPRGVNVTARAGQAPVQVGAIRR